jgi:uncharacterized MAPEG superfamily protein
MDAAEHANLPPRTIVTPAYAAVFAAFLLIYVPRFMVLRAQARMPGGVDNRSPREQQQHLDAAGKRANAAHANAFEAFAPFAAAVIIASVASPPRAKDTIDALAIAHVVLRAVYVGLYVGDVATARSLVWGLATLLTAALFTVPLWG